MFVLSHWFVAFFFLLFASTLQGWGPAPAIGVVFSLCRVQVLHPQLGQRFCRSSLTSKFQYHSFIHIRCLLFIVCSLQVRMFKYLFIILILQTFHRGWHIFFSFSKIFLQLFPQALYHVHANVVCMTSAFIFSSITNLGPLSYVTKWKSNASIE
jgi:hypothetical protein